MAQFTKALADDFNTVRNTVTNVLGTGSGTKGYGSPLNSSTVTAGQKITPTEFSSLTTDINACYRHITNANASTLASIVTGGTITWANFVTYQQAATYINTNSDTNGGAVTNPAALYKALPAGWGNASGNRVATNVVSISWASADAMRYFFNQGGQLKAFGEIRGATGNPKNDAFIAMVNAVNLAYTRSNYRAGTGTSQSQTTSTSPYSGGTADGVAVTFGIPGASSISLTVVCADKGGDNNVASNVNTDLGFYIGAQNVSATAGITTYTPTITWGGWTYAA